MVARNTKGMSSTLTPTSELLYVYIVSRDCQYIQALKLQVLVFDLVAAKSEEDESYHQQNWV